VKIDEITARDAKYAKSLADINQRHRDELEKLHSTLSDQIKEQQEILRVRDQRYTTDL